MRAETPNLGSWEKTKCVLCGNALATLSQTDVTKMARNRPDGGNNQQMEGGEECCAPPQGCVWRGGARASPAGTHQEVAWVKRWSADFSGGQGASRRSEAAERRSEPVSSSVLEGPGGIPTQTPGRGGVCASPGGSDTKTATWRASDATASSWTDLCTK